MKHDTTTLKASELIEDFSIYPRNCVFDGHVADLAEAIRSGAVFLPCIADYKTKRITDGFHRRRANIKVNGDDAPVEVILIHYQDTKEMVIDAILRNSSHGRRLTTADIARCALLAQKFKISRDALGDALHLTRDTLKDITGRRMARDNGNTVVLRRPMQHLAGTSLTKAQAAIVDHVGGTPAIQHVNILIKLIESKSLPDDDRLFEKLKQLHGLLEEMLVV